MGAHQGLHLGPAVQHVVLAQLEEVQHRLDVVELLDDDQLLGPEIEVLVGLHLLEEALVGDAQRGQGALGELLVPLLGGLGLDVVDPVEDPELLGLQAFLDHDQRRLDAEPLQLTHLGEADLVLDPLPDLFPGQLRRGASEGPRGELLLDLGPVLVPEHRKELEQRVPGLALEVLVVPLEHLQEVLGQLRDQLRSLLVVTHDAADPLAGAVLHQHLEASDLGVEGDFGVADDLLHLLEALFIVRPFLEVVLGDGAAAGREDRAKGQHEHQDRQGSEPACHRSIPPRIPAKIGIHPGHGYTEGLYHPDTTCQGAGGGGSGGVKLCSQRASPFSARVNRQAWRRSRYSSSMVCSPEGSRSTFGATPAKLPFTRIWA